MLAGLNVDSQCLTRALCRLGRVRRLEDLGRHGPLDASAGQASASNRFSAGSYHNGSGWPVDTGIIADGIRRHVNQFSPSRPNLDRLGPATIQRKQSDLIVDGEYVRTYALRNFPATITTDWWSRRA